MNHNYDISSDIGNDTSVEEVSRFDFSKLTKVATTGSTCDAYTTYYKGRHVFVKRLKEEKRNSGPYREALKKEYNLAVQLKHKAIPFYVDCGEDYIVTDYVDGRTLRSMIESQDEWLNNPKNIRSMLLELVDVVDYLHRHNVVHGDVKDDNVMITDKHNNVMLIDFDKALSYTFDRLGSYAPMYGVDKEEGWSPDMDFFGIGRIVDKLSNVGFPTDDFAKFRELCKKRGVSSEELREALSEKGNSRKVWLWVAITAILVMTAISLLFLHRLDEESVEIPGTVSESMPETVNESIQATHDTVVIINEPPTPVESPKIPKAPDYREIIAEGMKENVKPLLEYLVEAETLLADSTTTNRQLSDINLTVGNMTAQLLSSAYRQYGILFPNIAPTDIQIAVGSVPAYTNAMNRVSNLTKRVCKELARRDPELYEDDYERWIAN